MCESDSDFHILVRSQKQISFVKIKTGFLCDIGRGDGARAVCLLAPVIRQQFRFLDIENSSQRRLLPCLAPRRVHFARPWTQASRPALTDSSPAAKRRAEAIYFVFSSPSVRAHHDDLHTAAAAMCVFPRTRRSHERRALGALLFLDSRSTPASTDS